MIPYVLFVVHVPFYVCTSSSNIIPGLFRVLSVFRVQCVTNFASNIYSPQPPLSPSFILLSALCLLWNSFLKFSVWWLQFLQQENEFTVTPPSRHWSMAAATRGPCRSHWMKWAAPAGCPGGCGHSHWTKSVAPPAAHAFHWSKSAATVIR